MKWYVSVIFLVTGLSIVGLLTIFFRFDPYKATDLIKYLFFTSFFIALWGLVTLVLNRFKFRVDWPDFYRSFRIGLIISLVILGTYVLTFYIK